MAAGRARGGRHHAVHRASSAAAASTSATTTSAAGGRADTAASNLHEAIVQSCDVFFYQVGQRLGVDTIAEYARRFGLGRADRHRARAREAAASSPTRSGSGSASGEPWYAGETLSVAIGQGYVTATPLQMANVIATVANGGIALPPALREARRARRRRARSTPTSPEVIGDARRTREHARAGPRRAARRRDERARHRQEGARRRHRGRRQDRHRAGREAGDDRKASQQGLPRETARPRLVHRLRAGRRARDRDRVPRRARGRRRRRDGGAESCSRCSTRLLQPSARAERPQQPTQAGDSSMRFDRRLLTTSTWLLLAARRWRSSRWACSPSTAPRTRRAHGPVRPLAWRQALVGRRSASSACCSPAAASTTGGSSATRTSIYAVGCSAARARAAGRASSAAARGAGSASARSSIQPSEFIKLALVIVLARYFHRDDAPARARRCARSSCPRRALRRPGGPHPRAARPRHAPPCSGSSS